MLFVMAWRNIWRNKARSLIIMTSVSIGLFAGVFVAAIYKGMIQSRINTVIRDETAHLQVHHAAFKNDYEPLYILKKGEQLVRQIERMPTVKQVAPRSIALGMLATGTGSNGVEIRGIVPEKEIVVSQLDKKIIKGDYFGTKKKNELLVGKKLCDKMKLKLNNKVVLTFTDKENNMVAGAFRIAGIYQTANTPMDERIVYVKMTDLNTLLNIDGAFHELAVMLYSNDSVEAVRHTLQKSYPNLLIETWREISPETEMNITTVDQISLIIVIIIMLALALGIVNTMLMAILERTREIGMMLALGMNKMRLFAMVILETTFLTLSGVPWGLLLAWVITYFTGRYGINLTAFAKAAMEQFGYGSVIYPQFPVQQILPVLITVILTALLSAVFPALKALRLQPVDALRK